MQICFYAYAHGSHTRASIFCTSLQPERCSAIFEHRPVIKNMISGIIGTMLMKDPVFPVPSALIEKHALLVIIHA